MRLAPILLGLIVAGALLSPASAAPMRTWTAGDKSNIYKSGPLTLAFGEGRDGDGAALPGVQIQMPGFAPYSVLGQPGRNPVTARYAVVKLDPRNPLPQLLFSSNSGGEHCCNRILVVEKIATGWTSFDLGLWDGAAMANVPVDIDGDKTLDIVLSDDRFLDAFDTYEQSVSPPIVIDVYGGVVRDVSKDPRFRPFYAAAMAKAKTACAAHSNGACAGYAASAARAGKFDEAWKFVLASYDKGASMTYPARCAKRGANGGCAVTPAKPRDFPEALHWFLQDHGYIAR